VLSRPDGTLAAISGAALAELPQQSVNRCYIVSTGHGTSGPFCFEGVTLGDLLVAYAVATWDYADVVSADGFGTRIQHSEIQQGENKQGEAHAPATRPILLATRCDGKPLTRAQGLVRLIVPGEIDDALRQVKWVARIEVHATEQSYDRKT
jgi:DMSO/TMAO reductase YedYZ molybdopterin-dependent catalytic subunit